MLYVFFVLIKCRWLKKIENSHLVMLENLHWEAGAFRPGFLIEQNLVTGSGKQHLDTKLNLN